MVRLLQGGVVGQRFATSDLRALGCLTALLSGRGYPPLTTSGPGSFRAGPIACEDDVVVPAVAPLTSVVASEHPGCGGDRYQLAAVDVESDRSDSIAVPSEDLQLAPENADQGTTLVGAVTMSPTGEFPSASGDKAATIVALPD